MPITKIIIFRNGIHNKPQVNVFYGEDYVRLYFDYYEDARDKVINILKCRTGGFNTSASYSESIFGSIEIIPIPPINLKTKSDVSHI